MSVYESNRALPFGSITIHRVVAAVDRALDSLRVWRTARATRRVLTALSDHELDDIGLHRGRIAEIAFEIARR